MNPAFAREASLAGRPTRTSSPKSVLVVGAGPAGSELAALCAEQGHQVQLWERGSGVGGALAVAALARGNRKYREWIDYQTARLERVGVDVQFGRSVTADDVLAVDADLVAVATGSTPRIPPIPGVETALTAASVLKGEAVPGRRIAVISEDDGPAPLSVSDHLAGLGHAVTLIHQSIAPSPLVGKYSNGGMLARLIDGGVEFVQMARVTAIDGSALALASTYGNRRWTLDGFDSVVLVAGSIPNDTLYRELKHRRDGIHLLGDAFAPRRMVFATRQAWALAETLL